MASYNGFLCSRTYDGSTVSQTLGATASVTLTVSSAVPAKYFMNGFIALVASNGVSGTFGCDVIGSVGGATFVIAGRTGITAVGSYILGTTGIAGTVGVGTVAFPRPSAVRLYTTGAAVSGFTVSLYMAGEYN